MPKNGTVSSEKFRVLVDIQDPVYFQGATVCVGGDTKDLDRLIRKATGDKKFKARKNAAAKTVAWTAKSKKYRSGYWIWFRTWDGSSDCIARLAHEAYHHTCNVVETVRIEGEEAFAYYLAFTVRNALEALTRYVVKRDQKGRTVKGRTRRRSR